MTTLQTVKENPLYLQILKESCGGLMFSSNRLGGYDKDLMKELSTLWASISEREKESAGGIVKGVMDTVNETLRAK